MDSHALAPPGDPAQLVVDFVNTGEEAVGRPEHFGEIGEFARWATRRGLLTEDEAVGSDSDLAAARELRFALRTMLRQHADPEAVEPGRLHEARDYLARVAVRYPLTAVITDRGARLVAQGAGVPRLLGTVLAAATESDQAGLWPSVKACSSSPCEKAFIDRTRNHSARYCTPGCASRASMRTKRRRHKESAD